MKTSNKLLLGFLIVILIGITTFISVARYHIDTNSIEGNGKAKIHNQEIKGFNKINIQGRFTVHLIQGTNTHLEIRASENLIPIVSAVVENQELVIKLKNRISRKDKIELYFYKSTEPKNIFYHHI